MRLVLVGPVRNTRSATARGARARLLFLLVEGERDRRSPSGQRFALRPSAADCPPGDHRSLSLRELGSSLTSFARWAGLAFCTSFLWAAPLDGHSLCPPDGLVGPDTGACTLGGLGRVDGSVRAGPSGDHGRPAPHRSGSRAWGSSRFGFWRGGGNDLAAQAPNAPCSGPLGPSPPRRREEGLTVPRKTVCRRRRWSGALAGAGP